MRRRRSRLAPGRARGPADRPPGPGAEARIHLAEVSLGLERGVDSRPVILLPRIEAQARVGLRFRLRLLQHLRRLGERHHDDALVVGHDDVARVDDDSAAADRVIDLAGAFLRGWYRRGAAGQDRLAVGAALPDA